MSGLSKVINVLNRYNRFLITTHKDPEGDSLGSQLGLFGLLSQLGKAAYRVNEDPVPPTYRFLPWNEKIITVDKSPILRHIDVLLVVDCPNKERIGKTAEYITGERLVVNIDHHISNDGFGGVNWIDPEASAAGEMIYRLFKRMKMSINREESMCIYAAILTDTGSFRYGNTSSRVHRIASELLRYGLNPQKIASSIYEAKRPQALKLLAMTLGTLNISDDGKIAWVKITNEMFRSSGAYSNEIEGFVDYPRLLGGVKVAILFRETSKENEIKVSMRAKGGVNVNNIASHFGGGGHQAASGCLVKGPMDEVERVVIERVKKEVYSLQ
jgi:phosphoesterase RecJ-like protein